ncbi:MAG TPA: hypothetical protein VHT27_12165 [Solirubrobacteraceae bacterium]|nr:hypothetical protein [Solirubrobacteraceae bacterium]
MILATALIGTPGIARANWRRILQQPSATSPFAVCPPVPGRVSCAMIADPTRGANKRGAVSAGAITTGPELEVSPQLSGGGVEGGYAPAELRNAYGLSSTAGTGQTVAVVDAFDDPEAAADMSKYRSQYGIAACTEASGCFRKVNERGGATYPPANSTWAKEISLDLDMVSAICPNCHILLVEADSAEGSKVAAAEGEAVRLGASEISDSFAQTTAPEAAELAAYDHPGIPIAASGGDNGFGVVWPAASPHVIAVGGTALHPATRGWTETAWSLTGAGCSTEAKPAWQTDSCTGRTSNDVAAVADPNTPVSVYDSFETGSPWLLGSGTSVSAPIVAAAMALAAPYTRAFDGADALYLERANGLPGFDDISSGSDGTCHPSYLCEAGIGYDGPSGLGSLRRVPEVPPPSAETGQAGGIGPRAARLEGSVDPHGVAVSGCVFEYGTVTASGASVPCATTPGTGTSAVPVTAEIADLEPGTTYRFRLSVSYAGGSSAGSEALLTTAAEAPIAVTGATSAIGQTAAQLAAVVTPNGANVGECDFEYGPTSAYGSLAYCSAAPGSGDAPVGVSAFAAALHPNTVYHYRAVAGNGAGTGHGADLTFSTLPLAPTISTLAASGVGTSTATLNATVDPNEAPLSSCAFEFANALLPCSPIPGATDGAVAVSASVGGLQPATHYAYRIVAANTGGTVYGAIGELTTAGAVLAPGIPGESLTPPGSSAGVSPLACAAVPSPKPLFADANGRFALSLRCSPGHPVRGTIVLRMHSGRQSSRGTTSALASGTLVLPASGKLTLRLTLSPYGRRLLAQAHVLRATTTLSTGQPRVTTSAGLVVLRLRRSTRA